MGLVDITGSAAVMMIRREMVSWLRPVEALEQVVLCRGHGVPKGRQVTAEGR